MWIGFSVSAWPVKAKNRRVLQPLGPLALERTRIHFFINSTKEDREMKLLTTAFKTTRIPSHSPQNYPWLYQRIHPFFFFFCHLEQKVDPLQHRCCLSFGVNISEDFLFEFPQLYRFLINPRGTPALLSLSILS